ncbi:DUF2691 family protein [Bacillus toyonensis]|uniref:Uncharacterized protein n=1 Tax=Bacillus toyonensis TaxID=155322 RepID=A0A2C4R015_9BACI|nr:DUF2691 family protein [Bacillus toyonensis]PGB04167.1 hypothetical protein COL93_03445 [Bacillus toyonensis]PHD70093.1 hypothetical protein COF40_13160 [Bacillus toyonensis]
MNIGIHFHAPDDENFNLSILSLLAPFTFQNYMWQIDSAEIYLKDECGSFTNEMLFTTERFISGHRLEETLRNKDYYLIFLTLNTFPDLKKNNPT